MTEATAPQRRYNLFVSYSRDPDYRLARSLTGFLESFHRTPVPSLTAKEGPRLAPLKICLDGVTFSQPPAEGASETPSPGPRTVSPVLESYLAESKELLVLCSPQSARSPWVSHEIDWWLENRGTESIRLAITYGDEQWREPESFFPAAVVATGLHESICYDLRGFYEKPARDWQKVADFDSERVRLAADLNGESAGDILPLWFRDQRRRQRVRIVVGVAASAVLAATTAFALLQRQHGIEQSASRLVAESFELVERDPAAAMIKAVDARELHDTEPAHTAIETAYRVLIFHALNRRESAQLTGSGPGYLASRWREGDLYSVFSDNGRFVVLATKRSKDGAKIPGQVYLVDNETLRIIELESPAEWGNRRVEFVGFDRSNRHIFVTRQFYLAIFELDGSLVDTFNFSRFTKSPIHRVGGYFQDRLVMGADSKGGLWMVDPSGDLPHHTLQHEWHGDPLIWIRVDDDGGRAGLVFESGRAALLTLPTPDAEPTLTDVIDSGVLYAGFLGRDELVLGGEAGLLETWRLTEAGNPEQTRRYGDLDGDLDWVSVSAEGDTLLTTAYDNTVSLLDTETGTVLERINYADRIDWPSILRLPKQAEVPPGARPLNVAGRQWLASTQGAYAVEDGRLVRVTEDFRKIHDIVAAGGSTWILSGNAPSELLRIDGYLSYRTLRALGKVNKVLDLYSHALFATTNGVWRWHPNRFERVQAIDLQADSLQSIGGQVWAGTTRGLLSPGPAFLIDGLDATAFPDSNARVSGIIDWDESAWLLTGGPIDDFGPAYRVANGKAEAVPDERTVTHMIRVAGDALWLMTRSRDSAQNNGPAYRWDGERALPFPSATASVYELFELEGEVWFSYGEGDGQARIAQYGDADSFSLGDVWVGSMEKVAGAVWVATSDGAFQVSDKKVTRFPDNPLHVSRIVERAGSTWLLSPNEAHRVTDGRTVRYSTGEDTLADVVVVNGVTWLLTKNIVTAGPAFRVCGDSLVPYEAATSVYAVVAAGGDTEIQIQQPDFSVDMTIVPARALACE